MSTLLYALNRTPTQSDVDEVRSTVTVVDDSAPSAVQETMPDFNEHPTDPDTEGGLTGHQLGSHIIPSEQFVPDVGNANEDLNSIINRQVSTSGTAAAREAAGEWGHGSLLVVEGIEPTIRDGNKFGEDFFSAGAHTVQAGAGSMMTPAQRNDPGTTQAVQDAAEANSRAAVQNSQYAAFYHGMTGL